MINIFKLLKTITGRIEKRKRNITNNGKKKTMRSFLREEEKDTHSNIPRKKKSLNPRNLPNPRNLLPLPRLPDYPSLSPNPSRNLNRFSIPLPRFLNRSKKLLLLSLGIRWIS